MSAGGGPRLLLRRLREIMAEQTSAQMRLDKLVTVIASNMVAEVCSIYLRRAGKVLELFATEGLNRDRRPQHPAEGRRGPGRHGQRNRRSGEPVGRARRPAFLLPPGNRRRPVQVLPGRAHRARRPGVRRARRCRTRPSASMPRKRSRRCRPSPWCWPRWWRRAASSMSPNSTSRNCASTGPANSWAMACRKAWPWAVSRCMSRACKVERMIADNPVAELKRLEDAIGSLARIGGRDAGLQRARPDGRGARSDRGLSPVRL